jgi:hypothetical protein
MVLGSTCPWRMSMSMAHVHVHAACSCPCMYVCVCVCKKAGMPDCLASNQFSAGMKKTNDAGAGPVPDKADRVQHFFVPVQD